MLMFQYASDVYDITNWIIQIAYARQTHITGSLVTFKLCVIREFAPSISNVNILALVTDIYFKMAMLRGSISPFQIISRLDNTTITFGDMRENILSSVFFYSPCI